MEESFSRKSVARKIDLVSLYQVPKFNPKTEQLVCVVNYYTNTLHKFTSFEKPLLENHADMVEKLILEENPEHVEIEVLSEIEELLSDTDDNLTSFLDKILAKTSELIGADSGTISIHKILDGKPWLIIEDERRQSGRCKIARLDEKVKFLSCLLAAKNFPMSKGRSMVM